MPTTKQLDHGHFQPAALTRVLSEDFVAVSIAALSRVNDSDDDDYARHYAEPPFSYRLLAAACRQASCGTREHVVALLCACALPKETPLLTLEEHEWDLRLRDALLDLSTPTNADPDTLLCLQQELHGVVIPENSVGLDYLFRGDDDEYLVSVLHVALTSIIMGDTETADQSSAFALPSIYEAARSWLPRFIEQIAALMTQFQISDPRASIQKALSSVNSNPLRSFARTRLARAVSEASSMQFQECARCGVTTVGDVFVACGNRNLCNVCYEDFARTFCSDQAAIARLEYRDDQRAVVTGVYRALINDDVAELLLRAIGATEAEIDYDTRFHCPFNAMHQIPFHAATPVHPENPGAPVDIVCTQCLIKWCAHCSNVHHPHAAQCKDVVSTKSQWSVISKQMMAEADMMLVRFAQETDDVNAFNRSVDRAAALQKRTAQVRQQVSALQTQIAEIQQAIEQTKRSNLEHATWAHDGGWEPKEVGSRCCPFCRRQPIRRASECAIMVCGMNTHGPDNFQGGCKQKFCYNAVPPSYCANLTPSLPYQAISTATDEEDVRRLQQSVSDIEAGLAALSASATQKAALPTLADHWPTLSCSNCAGRLVGDFHIQCYHCVEPSYLLCIHCVRNGKHVSHRLPGASTHYFAYRKP
ncbi:Hypothetical protein, putative [Bodo saltans]|uniref:ZZ-type domain-containing protein n=1 Tax=Bodo saltans TaxID=75058 RepID=A0A0S4JEL4_BODSA|nr:Hypothetical protein, putative [Bodo saltans]|eukprot:CUG88561.1 Hypothetical protein, putative [Bodo saltans]